jgi:hypothetical protein
MRPLATDARGGGRGSDRESAASRAVACGTRSVIPAVDAGPDTQGGIISLPPDLRLRELAMTDPRLGCYKFALPLVLPILIWFGVLVNSGANHIRACHDLGLEYCMENKPHWKDARTAYQTTSAIVDAVSVLALLLGLFWAAVAKSGTPLVFAVVLQVGKYFLGSLLT